jgi:hypothetical protein
MEGLVVVTVGLVEATIVEEGLKGIVVTVGLPVETVGAVVGCV